MKLTTALARLGAKSLADMLGEPTVQLLELMDVKHLAPTRLAELLVRQVSAEGILLERHLRRPTLSALTKIDAQALVGELGLKGNGDPWAALDQVGFKRGQERTERLFKFFEETLPVPLEESLPPATQVLEAQYPLFPHQSRAYRAVYKYLTSGSPPRVLLHMPTGSGKTRTAMNVIAHFLREIVEESELIVWLAHTEELCEQAAEEFQQAWSIIGDRALPLYRHFGPYRTDFDGVTGGLLIGGLRVLHQHSLSQQSAFLKLARRVRLVVMDEAHQAVAPTYKHLLDLLAPSDATAILGLSATPGRSTLNPGEDLALANFFARNKVTLDVGMNPMLFLQQQGYLAKIKYDYVKHASGVELTPSEREELRSGWELPDSVIDRLSEDHRRNFLILSRIIEEADKGGKIIVFACSVEHAEVLANILKLKGYKAAAVTSRTPGDLRRQLIGDYKTSDKLQILTNFGVLTTGFDAPKTNVAVITRPTGSVVLYSQMVGRAARGPKAGGNKHCRIITVVDAIPGFRNVAEAFEFWDDVWTN